MHAFRPGHSHKIHLPGSAIGLRRGAPRVDSARLMLELLRPYGTLPRREAQTNVPLLSDNLVLVAPSATETTARMPNVAAVARIPDRGSGPF
jgi:hypothetical protein